MLTVVKLHWNKDDREERKVNSSLSKMAKLDGSLPRPSIVVVEDAAQVHLVLDAAKLVDRTEVVFAFGAVPLSDITIDIVHNYSLLKPALRRLHSIKGIAGNALDDMQSKLGQGSKARHDPGTLRVLSLIPTQPS